MFSYVNMSSELVVKVRYKTETLNQPAVKAVDYDFVVRNLH